VDACIYTLCTCFDLADMAKSLTYGIACFVDAEPVRSLAWKQGIGNCITHLISLMVFETRR